MIDDSELRGESQGDYDPDYRRERIGNNRKKVKTMVKRRLDKISRKSRQLNRRKA